jgi:hypothetical protein
VTAAYGYEDMHHLVDRLTPAQVRRLRLLVTQDEELSQVAQTLPAACCQLCILDVRRWPRSFSATA